MTASRTAPAPAPAPAAPSVRPEDVAGIVGEALAPYGARLRALVREMRRSRAVRPAHLMELMRTADSLQKLGMQSQQISRLATGRLRQSHERLSLDRLVADALQAGAARYASAGVQIEQNLRENVEVIVDPGLLVSLVEAAIDSQLHNGQVLSVRLHIRNWPEHAVLSIAARPAIADERSAPPVPVPADSPEWVLLLQLAQAMGAVVQREVTGTQVVLSLEFARTVKKLQGLTAVEVDTGWSALSDSRPMAGHRVLLIASDPALCAQVRTLCEEMGVVLDITPSSQKAVRFCELEKPDLILVEERLRDAPFEELRRDLLRYNLNFPLIELAEQADTVEMSSWMSNSISRVGRHALRDQLPSLLVMELAKVF